MKIQQKMWSGEFAARFCLPYICRKKWPTENVQFIMSSSTCTYLLS